MAFSANFSSLRWLFVAGLLASSGSVACSEGMGVGATGGSGATSTGGSAGAGGAMGTGGVMASGGSTGGISTGGASGGETATGGTTSGGGTTGGSATGGDSAGGAGGSSGGSTGGTPSGGAGVGGTEAGGSGGAGATGGSGGTGGGGTGGSGGDSGFQPCPETGPCKILPLGDSITVGTLPRNGGYRVELFRLAHQDGHEITFTGTQTPNGPDMVDGVPFPRSHAGIDGQTLTEIAGRIPTPELQEQPHIVLVHAGTNDFWKDPPIQNSRLEALLDELISELPDALIAVATIIPYPDNIEPYNNAIPGIVQQRADAGAHIILVDQNGNFPANGLDVDGVHPTASGYAVMGATWYDAIKDYLR